MDKMKELKEELKKTSAGRVFLEEAEPENHTNKLIEFAKEQCKIFPEDSEMGMFLRETLKMLQAEPCGDAISREDVIKAVDSHTFNTDDGLCLDEDISIILEEEVAPKQEFCGDCVSRKSLKYKLQEHHDFLVDAYGGFGNLSQNDKARVDAIANCIAMVVNEPPIKPARKTGKWIDTGEISTNRKGQVVHEVICSECNGISYFRGIGGKYIGANLCPNCGLKMEGEE